MKLRIGTRGSPLALAQAREVRARLATAHHLDPDDLEIVTITTTGDRVQNRPLSEIGGKGLFTKEIEEALLAGTIDLAVHSMKDMPAVILDGFDFAAILPREDARDAFISLKAKSLDTLPLNAVLGSSSVRRTAQALKNRPDLKPVGFRGNVETRLRKLAEGEADATFLAVAGLSRLGLTDKITSIIPQDVMLPAVAQGAIGIEILKRNDHIRTIVAAINHQPSATAIACERAFLAELEGSCKTPLAGHATLQGDQIAFHCEALTLDGRHVFNAAREGTDAIAMGTDAGREIKSRGGSLLVY